MGNKISDFEVGMRVMLTSRNTHCPAGPANGAYGTIVEVYNWLVCVDWDDDFQGGHDARGLARQGHGRWYYSSHGDWKFNQSVSQLKIVYEDRKPQPLEETDELADYLNAFTEGGRENGKPVF